MNQFIITTILSLISLMLGSISMWLAIRRPVNIPLTYETLLQERVNPDNEEVRNLLKTIHISPDDTRVKYLNFTVFKLWNSGKESVTLNDEKPLSIAFRRNTTILACEEIEIAPHNLEYTCRLEDEKILLAFPLLDPKDSVIFRILLTGYFYGFPYITVRVPGRKRIVRANNIRESRQMFFLGLFFLIAAAYSFVSTRSLLSPHLQGEIWTILVAGIVFLAMSWVGRKSPPSQGMLPSDYLWLLVMALPVFILLGAIAFLIYMWLGKEALITSYLITMCLITIYTLWWIPYKGITFLLEKRKIKYRPILVGILSGIPSLAFLILCLQVFLEPFLNR